MNAPVEKLVTDVKVLATDIEELLKATASQTGETITATRARAEAALAHARDVVTVQGRQAAETTDQLVRQNPWKAAGIAATVGVLLGLLLGRR
jgi:ElaB/YqjD/DUF883 family membrane-anchored ribosome-binding protein